MAWATSTSKASGSAPFSLMIFLWAKSAIVCALKVGAVGAASEGLGLAEGFAEAEICWRGWRGVRGIGPDAGRGGIPFCERRHLGACLGRARTRHAVFWAGIPTV